MKGKEGTEVNKSKEMFDFYSTHLLEFVEDFLPEVLVNKVPDFHREIYSLLLNEPRLVIAAPRGFAKSYICSFLYPLHAALFQIKTDICIISASEQLAIELMRKIRHEIENNQNIIEFFGDMRSAKWTENHLILKNGINIRAKGAGAQIRGFRPDLIILDDIETDESVLSEDQRKKLKDWLYKACINTLKPTGWMVIIGTLIHPLSVLNEIFNTPNDWTKKKYRAYENSIQEPGKEIWKDLWDHDRLQKRKSEIGSFAFASEFLNNPMLDESAPIKEDQVRYWETLPLQYSAVIAIDPAYSDDEKADYKVASLVAIDQNLNRYLVHYIRTHAPLGEFMNAVLTLWQKHKGCITSIGVPNAGVEKGFFDGFMQRCEERKVYPPIQELKNVYTSAGTNVSVRNKKARITASLQPLFEQGKYYIHNTHYEAREELLTIGASRWDDLVDSMSYAEQILQPSSYDIKNWENDYEEAIKVDHGDTGYGI